MKKCYALFLCILGVSITLSGTDFFRGYIVTKNGKRLTGYIGGIQHTPDESTVVFVNDFGTPYNISPELIRGFVMQKKENYIAYESKFDRQRWLFLRVIYKGDGMSLYKAPELRHQFSVNGAGLQTNTYYAHEYWLEIRGRLPFQLKRWGFKKQMRRLLRKRAPTLASRIGSPGYRFRDLEKIVKEFNDEYQRTQYQL